MLGFGNLYLNQYSKKFGTTLKMLKQLILKALGKLGYKEYTKHLWSYKNDRLGQEVSDLMEDIEQAITEAEREWKDIKIKKIEAYIEKQSYGGLPDVNHVIKLIKGEK